MKMAGRFGEITEYKNAWKKTVETHVKSKLKIFSLQRAEDAIDNFYFGRRGPTHNRPPPPPPPPSAPRGFLFLNWKELGENAESAILIPKTGNCGHLNNSILCNAQFYWWNFYIYFMGLYWILQGGP